MGKHITLYSSETIAEADFVAFALEHHCTLNMETFDLACERLPHGLFWICEARRALHGDFESPYADGPASDLDAKLGGHVKVALTLYLASRPGSAGVALEFARCFAERWRTAVECVAYDVFSAEVLDRLLESRRMPTVLCSELVLVLPKAPDFRAALEESDGLVLESSDQAGAAEATTLTGDFDVRTETIEGFFYGGGTDVWIVSQQVPEGVNARELQERFGTLVMGRLARRPRTVVRIVTGIGSAPETSQAALMFAHRMLARYGGVLVGDFETILDAPEIREWVASDYGWRLR